MKKTERCTSHNTVGKEVINITIPEIRITIPWTFFILTKKKENTISKFLPQSFKSFKATAWTSETYCILGKYWVGRRYTYT